MCSRTCASVLLFIFNFLFFIGGALLLAFGIAGLANPQGLEKFLTGIPGVENMSEIVSIPSVIISSSVFMIVLGSILVVFGFLGCAGVVFKAKWMLFIYWVFLILVILAEIALIIVSAVMPAKMESETMKLMYKSLNSKFQPVAIHGNVVQLPSDAVALSWVSLQFEVGCCGVSNYTDYNQINFNWNRTFVIDNRTTIPYAVVPPSCCKMSAKDVPKTTDPFIKLTSCLDGDVSYINTEGCYKGVLQLLVKYSYIPIIICVIVIFIEIVAIACAIYLWRTDDGKKRAV